jgi:hypothetical protein
MPPSHSGRAADGRLPGVPFRFFPPGTRPFSRRVGRSMDEAMALTRTRPRLSSPAELRTVAFGLWMVVGLLLDGWAHNHGKPESVFTPWHAVLYSGYLAAAIHEISHIRWDRPEPWFRTLPAGHGLSLAGIALFGAGAVGDLVWHTVFGVEANIEALLSPTHLVMLTAGLLILSGPFRSAWSDGSEWSPTFRRFLPALLSLALTVALVAFFFMYVTPFRHHGYGSWIGRYTRAVTTTPGAAEDYAEQIQVGGLAAVLVFTVILVGPLLLVLRRWRVPAGTGLVLVGGPVLALGAIDAFSNGKLLLAGPVAGLAADLLVRRWRPGPDRAFALRAVGAAVPVVLWLTFFAVFAVVHGLGWEPELWAGVTFMAALTGAGLGLLVAPPGIPVPDGSPSS